MSAMFEFSVREVLNKTAQRRMAVLRPLKVVIENYPEGQSEELEAVNHPDDPGGRHAQDAVLGRELYIERDDFMENPPKKFFRLSPGKEVRLRYAYFVTCREVVKDAAGEVVELRCTYDPATRGGNAPDGRKVQATLHWVSAADAVPAEVRLYNPLFTRPDPERRRLRRRPQSELARGARRRRVEPALAGGNADEPVQFERQGYFCRDADSQPGQAGVQPHRRPARHLGQGRRQGLTRQSASFGTARGRPNSEQIGFAAARRCRCSHDGRRCTCARACRGCRAWSSRSSRAGGLPYGGHGRPPAGRPAPQWLDRWAGLLGRAAQQLRAWALVETGPGRLVPWLAVAFGVGIVVYFAAEREPALWAGPSLLVGAIVIAVLARRRPVAFPICVGIAAMAAGFAAATAKRAIIAHPVLPAPVWSVDVAGFVEVREERERSDRIVVRVTRIAGPRLDETLERVRVSVRKGTAPPVGSFVEFKARLSPPLAPLRPGGYDFARDLYFQGIGASGFVLGRIRLAEPDRRRRPICATPPSSTACARRSTSASAPWCRATTARSPRR